MKQRNAENVKRLWSGVAANLLRASCLRQIVAAIIIMCISNTMTVSNCEESMNDQTYNVKMQEFFKFKVTCPNCKREWNASKSKHVKTHGPARLIGDDRDSIYARFDYGAHCLKCKTDFRFVLIIDYEIGLSGS